MNLTNKQLNAWVAKQLGFHVKYVVQEYLLYRPNGDAYREGIAIIRFQSEQEAWEYLPFTTNLNLAYQVAQVIVENYAPRYQIQLLRTFNSLLAAREICETYYNYVQSAIHD